MLPFKKKNQNQIKQRIVAINMYIEKDFRLGGMFRKI